MKLVGLLVGVVALASGAWAQCGMRPAAVFGGSLSPAGVTTRGDLVVANRDVVELYDVSGAGPARLDALGPWNGPLPWPAVRAVAVAGDVVGLALGDRVLLVDASGGVLAPRGSYQPGGVVDRLQEAGGLMYVVSGVGGTTVLDAVDVHDPANAVRLGRASLPQAFASGDLIGAGPWLYGRLIDQRVMCADVSDPLTPRTAVVPVEPGRFDAVEGQRLWITTGTPVTKVYDVSTPTAPALIGTSPVTATGLVRAAGVWFLGEAGNIRAMDLSDIAHPVELGAAPAWAEGPVVGLTGGRVAAAGYAFGVIDASNPAAMTTAGRVESPVGVVQALASQGSVLHVLQSQPTQALVSLDFADAASPRLLGSIPVAYRVNPLTTFMAASDGVVLVLTQDGLRSVLQVFDASDPVHVALRGSVTASTRPQGITIDGRLAVMAWTDSAMALLDLTDLENPRVVSTVPVSNGLSGAGGMCSLDSGVLVVGSRLAQQVDAYDVSDPASPRLEYRGRQTPVDSVAVMGRNIVWTAGGVAYGRTLDPAAVGDGLSTGLRTAAPFLSRITKGRTGLVTPRACFATDLPGGPYLRDWLAADLAPGRAAPTSAAEVPGALVSAGSTVPTGPIWISPLGAPELPLIGSGFLPRVRTDPPCIGEPYDLTVDVLAAPGEVTYQWYDRLDQPIDGATGPTLHFPRVTLATRPGLTYCVVTNGCGSRAYPEWGANWGIFWGLCAADFTCDQFVDFLDLVGFVDAFESGDPRADINGDEFLDFFDYADFVLVFESGC